MVVKEKNKKTKNSKFGDDHISNKILDDFGDVLKRGTEVLNSLNELQVFSVSPAVDTIMNGGIREGTVVGLSGPPKCGKEQPYYSKIYTPTGPVTMLDIKVGDFVSCPDGSVAEVVGKFPQGVKDVYRIYFNDNSYVDCGLEHLWKVSRNDRGSKWKIVSVDYLLKSGLKYSDRDKWKIPMCEKVYFQESTLPIDPYILGLLLGDGGLTQKSINFSSADEFILDKIRENGLTEGYSLKHNANYDYRFSKTEKGLKSNIISKVRDLGLFGLNSHNKFIPKMYKYCSIEQRLELIRGILDTDGYNNYGKNGEYTTVSIKLANDVIEILQSLGCKVNIKKRSTKCNGKEFPSYRISISSNDISELFKIPRKKYDHKRKKPNLFRTIKKIKKIGKEESFCIKIDHPDELYLTDNFTVTHNTTSILHFAGKCQKAGKKVVYLNSEGRMNAQNFDGVATLDEEELIIVESTNESILSGEKFLTIAERYIKNVPGCVVIIDSLSSLVPEAELVGELNAQTRNSLPRLLSQFFKRIGNDITRNKTILICIAHQIADTGPSRRTKMTDCGNMFQYQVSTNLIITHTTPWEGKEDTPNIGQKLHWELLTSNTGGVPHSKAEGWLRYGVGMDEIQEVIHEAAELRVIKVAGAWYTLSALLENLSHPAIKAFLKQANVDPSDLEAVTKEFKFQGIAKVNEFLEKNPSFVEILIKETRAAL